MSQSLITFAEDVIYVDSTVYIYICMMYRNV